MATGLPTGDNAPANGDATSPAYTHANDTNHAPTPGTGTSTVFDQLRGGDTDDTPHPFVDGSPANTQDLHAVLRAEHRTYAPTLADTTETDAGTNAPALARGYANSTPTGGASNPALLAPGAAPSRSAVGDTCMAMGLGVTELLNRQERAEDRNANTGDGSEDDAGDEARSAKRTCTEAHGASAPGRDAVAVATGPSVEG